MKINQLLLYKLESNCQDWQTCIRQWGYLSGSALKSSGFIEKTRNLDRIWDQWTVKLTSDVPTASLVKNLKWQWKSWFSSLLFSHCNGHVMPHLNFTCSSGFYFPISAYNSESSVVHEHFDQKVPKAKNASSPVCSESTRNTLSSLSHTVTYHRLKKHSPGKVWKLKLRGGVNGKKKKQTQRSSSPKYSQHKLNINWPKGGFFSPLVFKFQQTLIQKTQQVFHIFLVTW